METKQQWNRKNLRQLLLWVLVFACAAVVHASTARAADYQSAETLPTDDSWSQEYWLTDTDTEQWYRLTVPSDGKLTYKVMAYTYVRYQLYDEDLSTKIDDSYSQGSESSPDTDAHDAVLPAGTYYLKVYKGYNGKYKLKAAFTSYGTNDGDAQSYDSPQTVSLGSTVTGALTYTDTEDWYRVTISADGYYHYQVSAYTYVRYQLYNEDLSTRISDHYSEGSEATPDTDGYDVVLSKGTYYFKIYKGGSGKYTFTVSALSKDNCNHDYQTTYKNATYTKRGYTLHKCSKCGASYKDNYVNKKTLSTPYLYTPTPGKKQVSVSWSSVSDATGYQLSYKINGQTKKVKVKVTSKTVKKLTSKKNCRIRIRAYVTEGSSTVYSSWSAAKTVRIQ